jgi:glucans biosynthesis protein C
MEMTNQTTSPRLQQMEKANRFVYLDWMRVLSIIVVFFFHCARFFDTESWHVKNNSLSMGASVFVAVIATFIMPLFFFMSGNASWYALKKGPGPYLSSRVKRLLIPFLFGAFVILAPVQVWIERVTAGAFQGSFIDFYPHYFDGLYAFGGNFAWMGLHLWYLELLFIFSLITLPIFAYLSGKKPVESSMPAGAAFAVMIAVISLTVFLAGLSPEFIGSRAWGGWSFPVHMVFFIYGFLCARTPRFLDSMSRGRYLFLAAAAVLTVARILLHGADVAFYGAEIVKALINGSASWCWVCALTGIASRFLNTETPFLRYGNEAVLPFYMLHQTVIVVIGFFITGWDWPLIAKYPFLCITSFSAIMFAYEFLIRRYRPIRFLFGMK